jgi:hypothetical protein
MNRALSALKSNPDAEAVADGPPAYTRPVAPSYPEVVADPPVPSWSLQPDDPFVVTLLIITVIFLAQLGIPDMLYDAAPEVDAVDPRVGGCDSIVGVTPPVATPKAPLASVSDAPGVISSIAPVDAVVRPRIFPVLRVSPEAVAAPEVA